MRERTCVIVASSRAVFVALRERLTGCVEVVHPGAGTVYEVGRFDESGGAFEVALVEVEPGAVTAAVETERALSHWTPGLMLSVGTALGLEGCGRVGDVVVATRVYGYEAGTDTPEGFRARPELGMADHRLEQQARAEARSGPWRTDDEPATEVRPGVHLGPIAAGDKEIEDPGAPLVENLRWHCNDALAVERNGYAFHRAAHEHRMPALVLRGVAQRLGEGAGDEALARRNVVNFALRLLARVVGSDEAHDRERAHLERERAERGVDAWKAFFAEVMRVYELRRRRASSGERRTVKVRRGVGAFPRFALAVPEEDPRLGVELITAHSDTPSRAELETFVTESLAPRQAVDARAQATVVYAGAPPDDACREFARAASVRLESFAVFRGLIDFTTYLAKQVAELAVDRDRAYAPHLYVPQRMTWSIGRQPGLTEDALGEMVRRLRASVGMFVLILGDFGTGKTFLMRQLAQRLHDDHGPVPMMVNLRLLNKSPKLDGLLAAHWMQRDDEALFDPKALHYMMEAGDVVLLFDGFDELALRVTYERAAEHLATLVDAVKGKCRVVVTSRTQHFRNEDQSRTVLADTLDAARHQVFTLEKFDEGRIRRFLRNHLGHPREGAPPPSDAALDAEVDRRYGLLRDIKDLGGLAETPRMLGMILEIPVEDLQAVKEREGTITAAELYERLLTRWLTYEWERANPRGEAPGLPLEARWRFVTRFARRLWRQTDPSLPLETLTEEAAEVVREMRLKIDPPVAAQEAGSGTLLCRDGEGRFSFVHQSVLEYLIARVAASALRAAGEAEVLDEGELSTLMARFLIEQVGPEAAVRWAKVAPETAGHARQNAVRVQTTVDAEFVEVFDFHGQDLREVDLSRYRTKLARANLEGCTLSGMSLRGFVLREAKLRGATLRHADLREVDLTEADLSEADLTGAKLTCAKMEGVTTTGAVLTRTSFVGALVAPAIAARAGLVGGASVAFEALAVVTLNRATVFCVAFSPVGDMLAMAVGDTIWLVEVETHMVLRVLRGHKSQVQSVAFSPVGRRLATGSSDKTARLWDLDSGKIVAAFHGHTLSIQSVAFSPDGTRLATGSNDKTARLWDLDSGETVAVLQGHTGWVQSVAFSPDGTRLATGASDHTVRLWDLGSSKNVAILQGHSDWVQSVAFSPDGRWMATGSHDETARLWDLNSGETITTLHGHTKWVQSVVFSPDGKRLATGSHDETVRLWDLNSGKTVATLYGHTEWVQSVAFSSDGRRLATGSSDQTARLWDLNSGKIVKIFQGYVGQVLCVAFSPDGKRLATGLSDQTARLWDLNSGKAVATHQEPNKWVLSMAFSPDSKRLATGSRNETTQLWDLASGRTTVFQGHTAWVRSVIFSPDGRRLATGSSDQTARLWDLDSGKTVAILQGHVGQVLCVAFSPNGRRLATGSYDHTVRLWDLDSSKTIATLRGHTRLVQSVVFSPDGTWLATGSHDQTVRLWNLDSGKAVAVLQGHTDWVLCVAVSPDGARLATGSSDHTVRLWDLGSSKTVATLQGHTDQVLSVVFSPDSTLLATGSADGTIRLWEVASGRCLAILCAVGDGWIAIRPDGRYRMAGDLRGGVWHAVNLCRFELGELDGYGTHRLGDDEPLLLRDALVDVRPAPPAASADVNPTPLVAPVEVRPAPPAAHPPSPWPDALAGAAAFVGGTLALGATPTAAAASAAAGLCAAFASRAVRTRTNRPR